MKIQYRFLFINFFICSLLHAQTTVYFVSSNPIKKRAVSKIMLFKKGVPFRIQPLELKNIEVENTEDVTQVALQKAEKAFQRLGKPVLVSDEKVITIPSKKRFVKKGVPIMLPHGLYQNDIYESLKGGETISYEMCLVYKDDFRTHTFVNQISGKILPRFKGDMSIKSFKEVFMPQGSPESYASLEKAKRLEKHDLLKQLIEEFCDWYRVVLQKDDAESKDGIFKAS